VRPLFFLECVFFPVKLGTPMKPGLQANADQESDRSLWSSRMTIPGLTNQNRDFLIDEDARMAVAYVEMDRVGCRNDGI
jgi:hypothetical protein